MNTETLPNPTAEAPTRRKGNVARLPKKLRDLINTMLDDGNTYPQIIAALEKSTEPPLPWPISPKNLSNWFDGGYQDYLRNQAWNDRLLQRQEKFLDATGNDPVKLADAGMQIAATGLCELLDELSRIDTKDQNASDRYARLTNALTRLARIILTYAQHRDTVAKEKAAEPKQRDPNKPFGDQDDHRAVVAIVDKVLGIDRYRQKMMEEDAAAGRPWPSQKQSSATSNVAPATSADAAPVSNQPSGGAPVSNRSSEQNSDDRTASSSSVSLSSSGDETQREEANHSQTSTDNQPYTITDTEREERRPWNWNELSDQAIENWRKEHNLL